ncbi:MAG: hypothetical protein ABIP79_06800 [Chitinophagaceae bacterium]
MKKLYYFLLISCLIIFSIACKKDRLDIPIGTIKVDINGNSSTFSIQSKATRINVTGGYGIRIEGYFKSSSTSNLSFSLVRPTPITNTTYTENSAGNPLVEMTHCVEVLFPCVFRTAAHGSSSNPVSVTISEITGSHVKGTFKGELGGQSTEVLSNGVFYVSF